jgi:hypothetical protein
MRAGGMSLALRGQFKDVYIPCTMTTNNAGWERGWFYLRNVEPGLPPYTGRVFKERTDSWGYGFGLKSTSSRNRPRRSRQVLKPVRAKNRFLVNYNCYEACINIIFSFVLGPCCYS